MAIGCADRHMGSSLSEWNRLCRWTEHHQQLVQHPRNNSNANRIFQRCLTHPRNNSSSFWEQLLNRGVYIECNMAAYNWTRDGSSATNTPMLHYRCVFYWHLMSKQKHHDRWPWQVKGVSSGRGLGVPVWSSLLPSKPSSKGLSLTGFLYHHSSLALWNRTQLKEIWMRIVLSTKRSGV